MSATVPLNPLNLQTSAGPIKWEYFFGGTSGSTSTRFYFATINGLRVEKRWNSPGSLSYSIGNYDKAKKKFRTEAQLLKAIVGFSGEQSPTKEDQTQ